MRMREEGIVCGQQEKEDGITPDEPPRELLETKRVERSTDEEKGLADKVHARERVECRKSESKIGQEALSNRRRR